MHTTAIPLVLASFQAPSFIYITSASLNREYTRENLLAIIIIITWLNISADWHFGITFSICLYPMNFLDTSRIFTVSMFKQQSDSLSSLGSVNIHIDLVILLFLVAIKSYLLI